MCIIYLGMETYNKVQRTCCTYTIVVKRDVTTYLKFLFHNLVELLVPPKNPRIMSSQRFDKASGTTHLIFPLYLTQSTYSRPPINA